MRTSFAWSVLCQRIVVLLLSQRSFDLPEHTAPGDRGCHQSCTLSHCFWHPVLRWGGCLGFNFYFFAFAWDPCPSGGTRGYQGVWTWLYFFPLVFGIVELLSPSACRFQLRSAGPVSKLLTRLASYRPPGFLGLRVPVCGAQLKRRLCGRGGAAVFHHGRRLCFAGPRSARRFQRVFHRRHRHTCTDRCKRNF